MEPPQSLSEKPTNSNSLLLVNLMPKSKVPLTYLITLFAALRWISLAQCIKWDKMLTTFKMLSLVAVRYIKQPIMLLKYAWSILSVLSSLLSFSFWFIGALISLYSSNLNFLSISLAYFFWQIKTSCSLYLVSILRKKVIKPRSTI